MLDGIKWLEIELSVATSEPMTALEGTIVVAITFSVIAVILELMESIDTPSIVDNLTCRNGTVNVSRKVNIIRSA